MTEIDIDAVHKAAGSTRDPEIRRSLGELGLLDEVQIEGSQVTVHFHLTSPLCPTKFATSIGQEIRKRVEAITGVTSCEVVLRDHFLRDKIQTAINSRGQRMNATRILAGRREGDLLAFPSVRRMTDILSLRCRETSWVRTSVASLERFRAMTGYTDLEELREQALAEPALAEQALSHFASTLADYTDIQVSRACNGRKDYGFA